MSFHLVCTQPFHHPKHGKFERGQRVTDAAVVTDLQESHDHHFVRVAIPTDSEKK